MIISRELALNCLGSVEYLKKEGNFELYDNDREDPVLLPQIYTYTCQKEMKRKVKRLERAS